MSKYSEIDFEWLRGIDTPTICNIVEELDASRGGFGYTFQPFNCVFPDLAPIVGIAKTATIRARRPVARTPEQSLQLRDGYFDYVADGSMPKISVLQDLDEQPGYGAMWGEVSTHVHKALGVAGVVTNGSVRDVDMVASDFQLLAGSLGPSRAHVHYCAFACEVNVHGMTVNDGDLVHADKHGAVVIPLELIPRMPAALDLLQRKEEAVLSVARSPGCSLQALKDAHRAAASIKA